MNDVLTKKQRSFNMSKIKAKNTTPELKFRKLLVQNGCTGYRIHYPLDGKPDIVFVSKKLTIFIDGCFWHQCPKCFIEPVTRRSFWLDKINRNKERDKKVNKLLEDLGWKIVRFWEHEIKKEPKKCVNKILKKLKKSK